MNRELVIKTLEVLRSLKDNEFGMYTFKRETECGTVRCVFGHMVSRGLIPNVTFNERNSLVYEDTGNVIDPPTVMINEFDITMKEVNILFYNCRIGFAYLRVATLKVMVERWQWLLDGKNIVNEEVKCVEA